MLAGLKPLEDGLYLGVYGLVVLLPLDGRCGCIKLGLMLRFAHLGVAFYSKLLQRRCVHGKDSHSPKPGVSQGAPFGQEFPMGAGPQKPTQLLPRPVSRRDLS